MTDTTGNRGDDAQNAPQRSAEGHEPRPRAAGDDQPHRFDPFRNEEDMFKVLLVVLACAVAVIALALIIRDVL